MLTKIKKIISIAFVFIFLMGTPIAYGQARGGVTQSGNVTQGKSSGGLNSKEGVNNPNFQFDLRQITHDDINPSGWVRGGVNYLFERAIQIMAGTIGSAAVLMMVIGGFMMMISAGRQDMYDKGKGYLIKSLIGLAFVLGAYIIVVSVQLLINSVF